MYYQDRAVKRKKLLIIFVVIIVIIILAFIIYSILKKPSEEEIDTGEETGIFDFLPSFGDKDAEEIDIDEDYEIGLDFDDDYDYEDEKSNDILIPSPNLKDLSREALTDSYSLVENINPNITKGVSTNIKSNSLNFYDYEKEQFYKINKDGSQVLLSDKQFYKVQEVTWSPVEDQAILEYPDGSTIFYDFDKEEQHTLPNNWMYFDFDNTGSQIAFVEDDVQADYRWLSIANPDGTNKTLLEHLGENAYKVQVGWSPNHQIVAQYPVIDNMSRSTVYSLGQYGENFQAIYVDGADVQTEWSPSGNSLLASAYSPQTDFNPQLEIISYDPMTNEAESKKTINLNTWAEKCTYKDEYTILCAVPSDMISGAGMQPEVMKYTPDHLYEVDVQTGATKKIMDNLQSYTMSNLTMGPDNQLYFIDSNDGSLNKVYLD